MGNNNSICPKKNNNSICPKKNNISSEEKYSEIIECPICLDKHSNYIILKCGHKFHKDCIIKWSNMNQTCPICRCIILKQKSLNIGEILIINKHSHSSFYNIKDYMKSRGIEN